MPSASDILGRALGDTTSTPRAGGASDILGGVPEPGAVRDEMARTYLGLTGQQIKHGAINALPYAAAGAATLAQPEAGLPWLARLLGGSMLAGVAGAAAEPVRKGLAVSQGLEAPPASPAEAKQDIINQARTQALTEAGGRTLAGAAGLTGKLLYRGAFAKAGDILSQFPGALDKLLELRVPVGRWAALPWEKATGSKIATDAWAKSAETTAQLVAAAKQAGHVVDIPTLAQPLIDAATKAEPKMALPQNKAAYIKSIEDRANEIISNQRTQGIINPGLKQLEPQDVLDLRQGADVATTAARTAQRKAGTPLPQSQKIDAGLGDAARAYLHSIPGLGEDILRSDATTRALIGARRAAMVAEGKSAAGFGGQYIPFSAGAAARSAGAGAGAPPGLSQLLGSAGYLAEKSIASPEVLSRLGLLLRDPAMQQLLLNAPRAAGAATPFFAPAPAEATQQ